MYWYRLQTKWDYKKSVVVCRLLSSNGRCVVVSQSLPNNGCICHSTNVNDRGYLLHSTKYVLFYNALRACQCRLLSVLELDSPATMLYPSHPILTFASLLLVFSLSQFVHQLNAMEPLCLVTHGKDQLSFPMCSFTVVLGSVHNHPSDPRPLRSAELFVRYLEPWSLSPSLLPSLCLCVCSFNSVIFVSWCAHLCWSATSMTTVTQRFAAGPAPVRHRVAATRVNTDSTTLIRCGYKRRRL
jgi:hypothetical protein